MKLMERGNVFRKFDQDNLNKVKVIVHLKTAGWKRLKIFLIIFLTESATYLLNKHFKINFLMRL